MKKILMSNFWKKFKWKKTLKKKIQGKKIKLFSTYKKMVVNYDQKHKEKLRK